MFFNIIKNFSIADEKVGLCLSSGVISIDKNKFTKNFKKNKIFTIGFRDKTYDESRFIKSSKKNRNYRKILNQKDYKSILNSIKKEYIFLLEMRP